jgi:hypothetical protein
MIVTESTPVASRTPLEFAVPAESPQYAVKGFRYGITGEFTDNSGFYFGKAGSDLRALVFRAQGKSTSSSGQGEISFGPGSYWAARSSAPVHSVDINMLSHFGGTLGFAASSGASK